MSTSSVSYTVPSNSWTGSIDVTDCDLSTDIAVKDVKIFYDGVEQSTSEVANWAKVSVTSLSYSGSSLNMGDVVRIERSTPKSQIVTVLPLQTISSSSWNAEFTRVYNILEEQTTYGLPTDEVTVSDEAYGSGWNGITSQAPSKNSIYDKIESLNTALQAYADAKVDDTAYGAGWNSDTTDAPSKNAVYDILASTITSISDNRDLGQMQGRLTVTSGSPVITTNAVSGTLYYTPFGGTNVYLYDGSAWVRHTLTERSISVNGLTTDLPYDVFLYDNSGTLTLETQAWSNATTRATALDFQNGILVRGSTPTRRYIGTISPQSNQVAQGGDTVTTNTAFANTVYNYYNKVAGVYLNTQNMNFTSALGLFPWYSNSSIRLVNGYIDDFNYSMHINAGVTNATGSTQLVEVRIYSNTTSATIAYEGQTMANSTSAEFSVTSIVNAAHQLGLARLQAVYYTGSTSVTEDFGRVEVSFCY